MMGMHGRILERWQLVAAGVTLWIVGGPLPLGAVLGGEDASPPAALDVPAQAPAPTRSGDGKIWQWEHQAGSSLALRGREGIVWRLHFDRSLPQPYFDPLGTANGQSLTWLSPPDHAWHFGLWFSWKNINGINYWEFDGQTGVPAGTTAIRDVKVIRVDQERAEILMQLTYHPAGDAAAAVMDEQVMLQIETPREDGSYRMDWWQQTTARVDVELDRTPPPDQPGGASWGGYGGLSFRGAKELAEVVITDSQGRTDMSVHRQTAKWLDTSGTLSGQPVGVTFFDHPTNPRHPTPWFIVKDSLPHGPFTYMNPALLCREPLRLGQGQTLRLFYRVLVHPGPADRQQLEAELARFSELNPNRPRTFESEDAN